jgi:hypothetical protein
MTSFIIVWEILALAIHGKGAFLGHIPERLAFFFSLAF